MAHRPRSVRKPDPTADDYFLPPPPMGGEPLDVDATEVESLETVDGPWWESKGGVVVDAPPALARAPSRGDRPRL